MRLILILLFAAGFVRPVIAHHSVAEYDRSTLHELEGNLVDVRFRNPHVGFTLRVIDSTGTTRDVELQTLAPYVLQRAGVVGDMFTAGSSVRVAGWQSMRNPLLLNVSNMLLPSGEEILFYPDSQRRWSDDAVGSRWSSEPVASNRRDIFRIWSPADLNAYLAAADDIVISQTPEARANTPGVSPLDPCVAQGMPGIMLAPVPIQFIDRGEYIDLQLTPFGVLRRINKSDPPNLEAIPLSDVGYSVGAWIDDTFEVRTTRVGWPYLDDAGRPQTENVEIVERFSLSEDRNRLSYTQTVIDPVTLVEPMIVGWEFIDLGENSIEPLFCE